MNDPAKTKQQEAETDTTESKGGGGATVDGIIMAPAIPISVVAIDENDMGTTTPPFTTTTTTTTAMATNATLLPINHNENESRDDLYKDNQNDDDDGMFGDACMYCCKDCCPSCDCCENSKDCIRYFVCGICCFLPVCLCGIDF